MANGYHNIKSGTSRAYDAGCYGCQKAGRAIMLSFLEEKTEDFYDVFLTQEDAVRLHEELGRMIEYNKKKSA